MVGHPSGHNFSSVFRAGRRIYCSWTVHQCWCPTSTVDSFSFLILALFTRLLYLGSFLFFAKHIVFSFCFWLLLFLVCTDLKHHGQTAQQPGVHTHSICSRYARSKQNCNRNYHQISRTALRSFAWLGVKLDIMTRATQIRSQNRTARYWARVYLQYISPGCGGRRDARISSN